MKKTFLALALATAAVTAVAHPFPSSHYHTADGRFVIGNQIAPRVSTTYETDAYGRQMLVTTTTRCTDTRINPRNNHLICREEETTTQREYVAGGSYRRDPRPGYGIINPGYVNPGAVIGGIIFGNERDRDWRDNRGDWRNNDRRDHDRNDNRGDNHDRGEHRDHDRDRFGR